MALGFSPAVAFADLETGLTALDAGDVATAASEFQASFEAGDGDGAFYLGRMFEWHRQLIGSCGKGAPHLWSSGLQLTRDVVPNAVSI